MLCTGKSGVEPVEMIEAMCIFTFRIVAQYYTGSFYYTINNVLRKNDRKSCKTGYKLSHGLLCGTIEEILPFRNRFVQDTLNNGRSRRH